MTYSFHSNMSAGVRSPRDEHLADERLDLAGRLPDVRVIDRHVARPEQSAPFGLDQLVEPLLARLPLGGIGGQEDCADAVLAGSRQVDAQFLALGLKELMWDLREDAGAVAGQGSQPQAPRCVRLTRISSPERTI